MHCVGKKIYRVLGKRYPDVVGFVNYIYEKCYLLLINNEVDDGKPPA